MTLVRRNLAPSRIGSEASEFIKSVTIDGSEDTTAPEFSQQPERFNRAVSVHTAANRVIQKLARQYAITLEHAEVVAELNGIGRAAH